MSGRQGLTRSFRLDGRRALVTGAGRGIGRAAAIAFAEAGAEVTVASRTRSELESVVAEIEAEGGKGHVMVLDASDVAAVQAEIGASPGFHVFFNNAGTNRPAPFTEVTIDDYDAVTNINVRGAFFAAQAVVKGMLRDGIKGSIINMSSQMGHVGGAKRTVYCATKHAIEGMTKAMAADLAPHGIRVNAICPTFIETPMTAPFMADPAFAEGVRKSILLGRTGQVDDLVGGLVYLASDASSLMTGSALMIDGGWTAV